MQGLKLNVRLAALVLLMAGAVVALFSSGSGVSAQTNLNVEGVYCVDLYFHGITPPPKGEDTNPTGIRQAIIMLRVEGAPSGPWDVTTVGYNAAGNPFPTIEPSAVSCEDGTDGNTLDPAVPPLFQDVASRPQATGLTLSVETEGKALSWVSCTDTAAGLEEVWVRTEWNVLLNPGGTAYGDQTNYLDVDAPSSPGALDCGTVPATSPVLYTAMEVYPRTLTDDWDGDGISDWDELSAEGPNIKTADPFVARGVGGVAELPDVATTPLEAADSSSNTGLIAAIAAAAAVAVAAVGGVAMFARRRQE